MAHRIRLSRLLALTLTLGLLALPWAPRAAASGDVTNQFDAIVLVDDGNLPDLLASGSLGDYAVLTPTELGWEEGSLGGTALFGEDSVLTPSALGLDEPAQRTGGIRVAPFWNGFTPVHTRFPVPVFRFRPPVLVRPAPVFPFPRVAVVVVPPPPPVLVVPPPPVLSLPPPLPPPPPPPLPPPPPPPALAPPAPGATLPAVPIIPEAESLLLLVGGLATLAVLGGLRAWRHRS